MYRVINNFRDLKDRQYLYRVGDEYPRPGRSASEDRIKALLTGDNKAKKPLIEEIVEKPVEKKPAKKTTTKKTATKKAAKE